MKFDAVIFDMDGVLIDSELYWKDVDKIFFTSKGINLTEEIINFLIGRSEEEVARWLIKNFNLLQTVDGIIEERKKLSDLIYTRNSQPVKGVEELISLIKQSDKKLAVASSSALDRIRLIVDRFSWQKHFEKLVSADSVNSESKPDPGIYIHTAKQLGVEPSLCCVFEDSENGIKAAKGAGMSCVAYHDPRWCVGDNSLADLVIGSYGDNKLFDFLEL